MIRLDPGYREESGLWFERLSDNGGAEGRPALFLDRDGVLVQETHYLCRPGDVVLMPTAASVIRECNALGLAVVVVTNQAGIGRGLYGWDDFDAVQAEIVTRLSALGARLDAVLACACHEAAQPPYRVVDHPWRKPGPGMILAAAAELGIDRGTSRIVGDRVSDLLAGHAAGVKRGALVRTGHGESEASWLATIDSVAFSASLHADIGDAFKSFKAEGWPGLA